MKTGITLAVIGMAVALWQALQIVPDQLVFAAGLGLAVAGGLLICDAQESREQEDFFDGHFDD